MIAKGSRWGLRGFVRDTVAVTSRGMYDESPARGEARGFPRNGDKQARTTTTPTDNTKPRKVGVPNRLHECVQDLIFRAAAFLSVCGLFGADLCGDHRIVEPVLRAKSVGQRELGQDVWRVLELLRIV